MSVRPISIKLASFLALPILLLVGCGGESGVTVPANAGPTFAQDAFVAGFEGAQAKIWHVDFTVTPVTINATVLPGGTTANAMVKVGTKIYAVGTNGGASNTPMFWTYTTSNSTVTQAALGATGTGVAATASGTNVYFGGTLGNAGEIWQVNTTNNNVTPVAIPNSTSINSVAAAGNTLYATGTTAAGSMYWVIDISGATPAIKSATAAPQGAAFLAVAATSSAVYVSGTTNVSDSGTNLPVTAQVWTVSNAATPAFTLAAGTPLSGFATPNALTLAGTTLYVGGGWCGDWKSTVKAGANQLCLADLTTTPATFAATYGLAGTGLDAAYASSIAASSTAYYVSGTGGTATAGPTVAVAWMNQLGTPNSACTLLTDGSQNAQSNAIVVNQ